MSGVLTGAEVDFLLKPSPDEDREVSLTPEKIACLVEALETGQLKIPPRSAEMRGMDRAARPVTEKDFRVIKQTSFPS